MKAHILRCETNRTKKTRTWVVFDSVKCFVSGPTDSKEQTVERFERVYNRVPDEGYTSYDEIFSPSEAAATVAGVQEAA